MRMEKSACRICSGGCGTVVSIDDAGTIVQIRGDRDHALSRGYACIKGLEVHKAMYRENRVLRPLKRLPDGTFEAIELEQALDEIAERLGAIRDEKGGDSIGMFNGTAHYNNAPLAEMLRAWLPAVGSRNRYSTMTIDQSAHQVTEARMGSWSAGRQDFESSDVALLIGCNPLVSLGAYFLLSADPMKRLKQAKAKGLKLIVIDPRRTETVQHADCFLQPIPGEDAAIVGGLIRIILAEGWEDREFCARYVDGLEEVRAAVDVFTPDYVAKRAGISAANLQKAAAMFARDAKRGIAITGTGATMAPHSNLTDHLTETLNAICGRYLRPGDRIPNRGALSAPREYRAEVVPAARSWESGPKNPLGQGRLIGEYPSSQLPDHILLEGEGSLRALFVNGANPATCLPDQRKAALALQSLDLLVTVDPYMTATARLSDYVIPPKIQYERTDVLYGPRLESSQSHLPFAQYLPAIVSPPQDSELIDDWYLYWSIAARLGLSLRFAGRALDLQSPPTTDELLEWLCDGSRVPFADVRKAIGGALFDDDPVYVTDAGPSSGARLQLTPGDVLAELTRYLAKPPRTSDAFPFLLIVRRDREIMNSHVRYGPSSQPGDYNAASMNPDDLAASGLAEGDQIALASDFASIPAIVEADATLRRGIISMIHCRGGLPEETDRYREFGVSTSLMVRTDQEVEAINFMPVMTAIPIRIDRSVKVAASA